MSFSNDTCRTSWPLLCNKRCLAMPGDPVSTPMCPAVLSQTKAASVGKPFHELTCTMLRQACLCRYFPCTVQWFLERCELQVIRKGWRRRVSYASTTLNAVGAEPQLAMQHACSNSCLTYQPGTCCQREPAEPRTDYLAPGATLQSLQTNRR